MTKKNMKKEKPTKFNIDNILGDDNTTQSVGKNSGMELSEFLLTMCHVTNDESTLKIIKKIINKTGINNQDLIDFYDMLKESHENKPERVNIESTKKIWNLLNKIIP
ncbi:MAG: hypothetical protein ACQES9_08055, partial [Myxococcota bacterium]